MVEMGRGSRRRRWWLWLLSLLALLVGAYFFLQPRIISIEPVDGAAGVATSSPFEIQFNRAMDKASVEGRMEFSPEIPGRYEWRANRLLFIPDLGWPEGEVVEVRLRAGVRSALSLPILINHSWRFSVSQPSIAYLIDQAGQNRLELRVLNEPDPQVLVETPKGIRAFHIVPEQAALVTVEMQNDGGSQLIWRTLQGEIVRQLHSCAADLSCRQPALSANGEWLAWQQRSVNRSATGVLETGPWQVYLKKLEVEAPPQLVKSEGETHSPSWIRPDRLGLYSEALKSLLVYRFSESDGAWQQVAQVEHQLGEQWTWSPDGRFVIFPEVVLLDSNNSGVSFFSHLIRVEVESGLSTDLSGLGNEMIEDASPAYSPDGLQVAFARKSLDPAEWSLGRQLFVMASDGSEVRPLTNEANFNHAGFRWHADGKRLLYIRFNQATLDSPTEIWWYDLTTDRPSLIVEGGFDPEWMP